MAECGSGPDSVSPKLVLFSTIQHLFIHGHAQVSSPRAKPIGRSNLIGNNIQIAKVL